MAQPVALVLEDEALIAMHVEMTLQDAGFDVVVFTSCREAEQWIVLNSPEVAVVDVSLSDGSPVEATRILIERGIPFIVHSGDVENGQGQHEVYAAGAWLQKPSMSGELMTMARSMVGLEAGMDT